MTTKTAEREMNIAPMPTLGSFVKLSVGMTIKGDMTEASFEVEKKEKNVKGKKVMVEKDRYHFKLALSEDTELLVGPKKQTVKKMFRAGEIVTLPEHGFLVSALRRTSCEVGGKTYNVDEETDLKPLIGLYFEITRDEDKDIQKGEFKGVASATYDVQYSTSK